MRATLLSALLLASPAATSAQGDEGAEPSALTAPASLDQAARVHFELASAHYEAGRFEQAAEEFQRAYDLSERPQLLHNIYLARRDQGDVPRAAEALRQYLARAEQVQSRPLLERRLEELDRQVAESDAGTGADAAQADDGPGRTDASTGPDVRADPGPGPWIVIASGGVVLVGSLVFNRLMAGEDAELDELCPGGFCPVSDRQAHDDAVGRFKLYRGFAWALLAGGIAALSTGIAWLALASGADAEQPPIAAACTLDGCRLAWRAAF